MSFRIKPFLILTLPAVLLLILVLPGCKKYENGPAISLRSKSTRLEGQWKVDRAFLNDEDVTYDLLEDIDILFDFNKSGTLMLKVVDRYSLDSDSSLATWDFSSDSKKLQVMYDGKIEMWEINRLTDKEFWFVLRDPGGDKIEYRLFSWR